jgi:hypothetical protein
MYNVASVAPALLGRIKREDKHPEKGKARAWTPLTYMGHTRAQREAANPKKPEGG